jgi:ABC-2 type transport system permease protein
MRVYFTLTRRELAAYFLSLTGYVIIAGVMFLLGYSFLVLIVKLRQTPTPAPVTEMFYQTQFFWLILLLATPAITMRLFALEKFTGTFETLMTTPVGDIAVVLAKFTAALVFYLVMWLPLLGCIWVVRHYTNDPSAFDIGAVASTFLGLALVGAMLIAAGCCASAITRNQVVAAVISLVFGTSLFLLAFLADQLPARNDWGTRVLECFALFQHLHYFSRGVIDTRPVVLYLSLTFFFLYLTLRIIESRRWK